MSNDATLDLDSKVALVTGAAQNLGAAISIALAKAGAKVVLSDIADCSDTLAAIKQAGGEAIAIRSDITKDQDCRDAVTLALDSFGRLDALVNNAALYGTLKMTPFDQIADKDWSAVMDVNITGVWRMCKAGAAPMRKARAGSIINMSSSTARHGIPNLAHYIASKGAVISLTRALARELGPDLIRVNTVAPTGIASESTKSVTGEHFEMSMQGAAMMQCIPLNPTPGDIAGTIIFLASDASRFMTGQILAPDCGIALL